MQGFMTPPGHSGFLAKKLFETGGKIQWGAIAHIEPQGGGPTGGHTHPEDHLFLVIHGTATICLAGEEVQVGENQAFFVEGGTLHSIWNRTGESITVVKISTTGERAVTL